MEIKLYPKCATNPIVYLDVNIGEEFAGRVVIELRADVVPKTAENFRGLCTGEYGLGWCEKPLHYKGIRFHKVQRLFAVQSGDIMNNDGTGGESIYGPFFEDENFILKHEELVVSMRNFGKPNTNNSQFVITTIECGNLDGSFVVVGRVLRGSGALYLMDEFTTDDGDPTEDIFISDCGELSHEENLWGLVELDDILPLYPLDVDQDLCKVKNFEEARSIVIKIRLAGNEAFASSAYYVARRKYRKAIRYTVYFELSLKSRKLLPKKHFINPFDELFVINQLNMATVEYKLGNFEKTLHFCHEAEEYCTTNPKIYYRRGQAHAALQNYDEAIKDFKKATELQPNDKLIQMALSQVVLDKKKYTQSLSSVLKKLF